MKFFYTLFLLLIIFFSRQVFAEAAVSDGLVVSSCVFTETLRVGSLGGEVKCVQSIVGANPDGHFGPLTKTAVAKWQAKMGLSPDGVVGPITRVALADSIATLGDLPPGCTSVLGYSPTTGKKCDSNVTQGNTPIVPPAKPVSSTTPIVIPGTNVSISGEEPESLKNADQNIEAYISAVKMNLVKNNVSPDKISFIEEKIRKTTEKNPNALQQFFNDQKTIYSNKISEKTINTPLSNFFKKALSFVDDFIFTNKALAASLAPFGGFVTYSNPAICDCPPGVFTQIFIALPSASPPISNIYLDYLNGSQAFLNYNMPEPDIAALGFYTPGTVSCYTYVGGACVPIPSYGLITPVVGSSLAP